MTVFGHAWRRPKTPLAEDPARLFLRAQVDRYRLHVGGPLPGAPREYGSFVMIVRRRYSDNPRAWWISPDA